MITSPEQLELEAVATQDSPAPMDEDRIGGDQILLDWLATPRGQRSPATISELVRVLGLPRQVILNWLEDPSLRGKVLHRIFCKEAYSNLVPFHEMLFDKAEAGDVRSFKLLAESTGFSQKKPGHHRKSLHRSRHRPWWIRFVQLPIHRLADEVAVIAGRMEQGDVVAARLWYNLVINRRDLPPAKESN